MRMSIVHATDERTTVHRARRARPRRCPARRGRRGDVRELSITATRADAQAARHSCQGAAWRMACAMLFSVKQVRRQAAKRSAAAPLRGYET
jgi:hypothetical protein